MIYHYLHIAGVATVHAMGTYGVYIFFVLSGYTLYHVYSGKPLGEDGLRRFFLSRFFRIVPLLSVLVVFQTFVAGRNTFAEFLLNISLLFGLTNPLATSATPAAWSIGIEAVFYLMFPLLLLFRAVWSMTTLFVFTLALHAAYTSQVYSDPTMVEKQGIFYTQAANFLCYFVGGMLLAKLSRMFSMRIVGREWIVITILISMFVLPTLLNLDRQAVLASVYAVPLMAGTYLVVAFAAGPINSPLIARLGNLLGDLSYSVYLLHYPIATYTLRYLTFPRWVELIIAGIITMLVSYASFRWFENKIRLAGKNWAASAA